MGPHLELRWEAQGSSRVAMVSRGSTRVAMGTSGILSICIRGVWSPFICEGNVGILSSHSRGIGPHFKLRQGTQGSFRVVTVVSGILSSWDRNLTEPLRLPQGSQASFRVARVISGFLSSHCRGIGPHLELRWGNSGFLFSCDRGVRTCLVLKHGTPVSS